MDVLGGTTGLNYADDYRTLGEVRVAVTRRMDAADAGHRKIAEPLVVSIDLRDNCCDPV